jgi:hypothetical protein
VKKKTWIRALGWLSLAGYAAAMFAALILATSHDAATRQTAGGVFGLAMLVAVPCMFVWIPASIIDGIMRRQAGLQGAAIAQAMAAGRGPQAPGPQWPAPAAVAAPQVPVCAQCRRYLAEFVCNAHNWPLCSQCAGPHTQTTEGCTLRGLQPIATAPAPRPRAVSTSPLAGMR